eukprot:INCI19652.1.p1 GENE.INCI19652.1~~INCI19652.1.p1  ORF type:complete len:247 (+),score=14.98 INCI19652.1:379-1119(+)
MRTISQYFWEPWALIRAILIAVVCLVGDRLGLSSWCSTQHLVSPKLCTCLIDSLTHGCVGLVVFFRLGRAGPRPILHALFVYACSVVIDIDHFLSSGSFSLHEATEGLISRPLGHCFSIVLALGTAVYGAEVLLQLAHTKLKQLPFFGRIRQWVYESISGGQHLAYFLVGAVCVHELRDSWRRGFWLCPFGSIPVSYSLYVVLTIVCSWLHDFAVKLRCTSSLVPLTTESHFDRRMKDLKTTVWVV